jgi:hypothetical protein
VFAGRLSPLRQPFAMRGESLLMIGRATILCRHRDGPACPSNDCNLSKTGSANMQAFSAKISYQFNEASRMKSKVSLIAIGVAAVALLSPVTGSAHPSFYGYQSRHDYDHDQINRQHDDEHDYLDDVHREAHEEGLSYWEHERLHRDLRREHAQEHSDLRRKHRWEHWRNDRNGWYDGRRWDGYYGGY